MEEAEDTRKDQAGEQEEAKVLFSCDVVSNIVPKRGIWWHVIFTVIFVFGSGIVIYFGDWALLFFLVVAAGYSLWRGHEGRRMTFTIDTEGVKINDRRFRFNNIDNFYFGQFGDNHTINFFLTKKYIPRLTYLLLEESDLEKIRKFLQDKVPETEPAGEAISDFIIRKLKI